MFLVLLLCENDSRSFIRRPLFASVQPSFADTITRKRFKALISPLSSERTQKVAAWFNEFIALSNYLGATTSGFQKSKG